MTPELNEIELKIKILDEILQEARANNDDRWHEPARQIELLNERRGEILKSLRDIPSVRIIAKPAIMGAKGE